MLIGIVLQTIALLYIAIFLHIVPIAKDENYQPSASENSASTGAIAMIYISGVGWALGWNSGQVRDVDDDLYCDTND